jgi:hypothetical protein
VSVENKLILRRVNQHNKEEIRLFIVAEDFVEIVNLKK